MGIASSPEKLKLSLASHEHVKQICVVSHRSGNGSKRLVAYYVPSRFRIERNRTAKVFWRGRLPEFMIPALFVAMKSAAADAKRKDRSIGIGCARRSGSGRYRGWSERRHNWSRRLSMSGAKVSALIRLG